MKEKFIFLLLSILIFSCKDDDNQLTPPENLFTIDLAKEWFETKFKSDDFEYPFRIQGNDSNLLSLKPLLNWDIAQLTSDSVWTVVELPWEYENGLVTYTNSEVKQLSGTNNMEAVQVEKLIIIKNRISKEVYGFKMRIIPDLTYLQLHADNIAYNSYLKRDLDLSGSVLFYSISDEFVNGWKYADGKVVAQLKVAEAEPTGVGASKISNRWDYQFIETCRYSYVTVNGIRSGTTTSYGCTTEMFIELVMEDNQLDYTSGLADYSYGGGGSTVTAVPVDPCAYLKSLKNDQRLTEEIKRYYDKMNTTINEQGFIREAHDKQNPVKHKESTPTNITFEYSSGTKYCEKLHTHPTLSGGTPFPSPKDLKNLYSMYKEGRMQDVNKFRYIIVSKLGVSCLMITDIKAFDAFAGKWMSGNIEYDLDDLFLKRDRLYGQSQSLEAHLRDLLMLFKATNAGLTYYYSNISEGGNIPEWSLRELDSQNNLTTKNCN